MKINILKAVIGTARKGVSLGIALEIQRNISRKDSG